MIDRLELSVPEWFTPTHKDWPPLERKAKPQKTGAYYFQVDCRNFWGFFVFHGNRYHVPQAQRHIRIVYEAVRMRTATDICLKLQSFFGLPEKKVLGFRVARIDFAVNVPQPVEWFRHNMFIKGKQTSSEFVHQRTRQVETLIFGKQPDRYIVYDKVRERLDKSKPLMQSGILPGQLPRTVTRIERQCHGISVPVNLRTLGSFLENVATFDPFKAVELLKYASPPNTKPWTARRWLMNLGVGTAIQELGLQAARKECDLRSRRNHLLDRYMELATPSGPHLTRAQLTAAYKASTIRQLNIPQNGVYPQGGDGFLL